MYHYVFNSTEISIVDDERVDGRFDEPRWAY